MTSILDWLNAGEKLITDNKISAGQWIKDFFDFIKAEFGGPIDVVASALESVFEGTSDLIIAIPPLLLIPAFGLLAYWLRRNLVLAIGTVIGCFLILNWRIWDATIETMVLAFYSTVFSLAFGIPIGILCARTKWLFPIVRPILDMMQTLPTLIYLVPALSMFGLGMVPGVFATIIFALPAPIRMTYVGISSVPLPLIEAGLAFGATRRQLLFKVEMPHALPIVMEGVTQCVMLSLSMVVIATLVGSGGLGAPVIRALQAGQVPAGFDAGLAIVIIAIIFDRLLKKQAKHVGKRT